MVKGGKSRTISVVRASRQIRAGCHVSGARDTCPAFFLDRAYREDIEGTLDAEFLFFAVIVTRFEPPNAGKHNGAIEAIAPADSGAPAASRWMRRPHH